MVNICEVSQKRRDKRQAKDAERLGPKGTKFGAMGQAIPRREHSDFRRKEATVPTLFRLRNMVSPYSSQVGKLTARKADERAGKG